MARDLRSYLEDLRGYLARLQKLVEGKSARDFEAEYEFRWAVERGFEIVGEILRRMTAVEPETAKRIDFVGRIIGFRNFLAHEYDSIEDERVWSITQQNLPHLIEQVNAWAVELGMEKPPEPAS